MCVSFEDGLSLSLSLSLSILPKNIFAQMAFQM